MIRYEILKNNANKFIFLLFLFVASGCAGPSTSNEFAKESIRLQQPVDGNIIRRYDGTKNKGIDFSAKEESVVHAAASGEVVYSGTGLRGFGVLVIIKHGANFLTAYSNNKTSLVRLGEHVQSGQQIAILGETQTGYVELHFELRKNGKAINPEPYMINFN